MGMLATDKEKRAEKEATLASFLSGATRILVTTDAALRALSEQLPPVGHVISFDFPPNMGEYAARLAHTACGGHTGRVTTFVNDATPKDQIELLAELLQQTGNEVPRWLEGMASSPAPVTVPVQ